MWNLVFRHTCLILANIFPLTQVVCVYMKHVVKLLVHSFILWPTWCTKQKLDDVCFSGCWKITLRVFYVVHWLCCILNPPFPGPSDKDLTDNEELHISTIIKISKQCSIYIENTSIKGIYNRRNDINIYFHLLTIYNILVALYFNNYWVIKKVMTHVCDW